MTAVSTNAYINKLDEIVDKYNNRYHTPIRMNPANFKSDMCIEYGVNHNEKYPKIKDGD